MDDNEPCCVCGISSADEEMFDCAECGNNVCEPCSESCASCDSTICRSCEEVTDGVCDVCR